MNRYLDRAELRSIFRSQNERGDPVGSNIMMMIRGESLVALCGHEYHACVVHQEVSLKISVAQQHLASDSPLGKSYRGICLRSDSLAFWSHGEELLLDSQGLSSKRKHHNMNNI